MTPKPLFFFPVFEQKEGNARALAQGGEVSRRYHWLFGQARGRRGRQAAQEQTNQSRERARGRKVSKQLPHSKIDNLESDETREDDDGVVMILSEEECAE